MDIHKTGKWSQAFRALTTTARELPRAIKRAPEREALFYRDKIIENIRSQGSVAGKPFAPLSPTTLLARRARGIRGDKALIATGEMARSVTVERTFRGYFVGVPARKRGRVSLAKIAQIHEEGFGPIVIKMTPKMRRFLFGVILRGSGKRTGGGSRRGYIVVRIPARPFIRPVFTKFGGRRSLKRILQGIAEDVRGSLGAV